MSREDERLARESFLNCYSDASLYTTRKGDFYNDIIGKRPDFLIQERVSQQNLPKPKPASKPHKTSSPSP